MHFIFTYVFIYLQLNHDTAKCQEFLAIFQTTVQFSQ